MRLFQKSISILMAFLVFGSSVCFAKDVHICEGDVWSVSYTGYAESCGQMDDAICSLPSAMINPKYNSEDWSSSVSNESCCSQERYICSAIDGKSKSDSNQDQFSLDLLPLIWTIFTPHLFPSESNANQNKIERPPSVYRGDYQAIYQVFII
ncbi:MAG: hypothetical protein P8M19_07295 [Crocinitomicaceae bacterium]|nr:hypothetical protein [Crocinitomicaceae bacterium]